MKRDPAWEYGTEVQVPENGTKKAYKYVECNFCEKVITGGIKRLKEHLVGSHNSVAPCTKVSDEAKAKITDYLKSFRAAKHMSQMRFTERMDSGFVSGSGPSGSGTGDCVGSCPSGSKVGQTQIDRFMIVGDVEDGQETQKMTPALAKQQRKHVCLDIGRFFYENAIPFHAATTPSYFNMIRSVGNYGRGLKAPTMHELRTWVLEEEEQTTIELVKEVKKTWQQTGVSILSDGWSDMRNRSLINFLVNNQHGTVFLKTVDASNCVKDAKKLCALLDEVVEEVGEEIVIQVVTDNAAAYKLAGKLLMEKRPNLYWTPCDAHCIDLMLEKIGDLTQHKNALSKAKIVSNFIYNHQWVLSLFRKFAGKDLLRPAATRFATAFLTLNSMLELKQPLQQMFVSSEWSDCAWAKKGDGKDVKAIVMNDKTFWPSVVYAIKTTQPLVHVLRMVDGEKMPAMAFLYGAMDEAKEKIKANLDGQLASYKEIWDIIDLKWDKQLHRDLHSAAYYLNPRFRYDPEVSKHPEITTGLYKCMERLIPDSNTFALVDKQIDVFKYQQGLFGFKAAKSSYMTRPPVAWWDNFGDEVPELKSFAMKVLGLTCSASACERNWSTFNQVHTKRRNRLTTSRLNTLVYIMYNRRLKHKYLKVQSRKDEDDPLIVENVTSDDEWTLGEDEANTLHIEDENDGGSSSARAKKRRKTVQPSKKGKGKVSQAALIDDEDDLDDESEDGDDSNEESFEMPPKFRDLNNNF